MNSAAFIAYRRISQMRRNSLDEMNKFKDEIKVFKKIDVEHVSTFVGYLF